MSVQFWLIALTLLVQIPSSWAQEVVVPVLYWSSKIEGQVVMRQGFEEVINAHNEKNKTKIKLISKIAGEGRDGIFNQVKQFDEILKTRPQFVVIQPTDSTALIRGLKEANRLKIPVITFDQYILQGQTESYITSDNYKAGWDNGVFIHQTFPKEKEIKVAIFEYPHVSSTIERVDGFFDALRESGRSFIVVGRYSAVDPESGRLAAASFLKDHPVKGSVDLIFSVNDGGGLTIVKTLRKKGRNEILHVSVDGDPQSVANIKSNHLTIANSAQFCAELGRQTANQLVRRLQNESVEKAIRIPTFLVTKKSVKAYGGWTAKPMLSEESQKNPKKSTSIRKGYSSAKLILTVKVGIAPQCPYLCAGRPGVWSGYLFEIMSRVAKKYNFNLDIRGISNYRLIGELKSRQLDFIVVPGYLSRYRSDIRVKGPRLGLSYTAALVRTKDKLDFVSVEDLKNKSAVFAELGQEADLTMIRDSQKVLRLTGSDIAVRMKSMVQEGRIDIALGDQNILNYALKGQLETSLDLKPTSITGINPLVLVANVKKPNYGNFPELLESWMQDARKSGELEKILKKYNMVDWQQMSPPSELFH